MTIRRLFTMMLVVAAVASPAAATASSTAQLQARERTLAQRVEAAKRTLRFFERHPRLLYAKAPETRRRAWHEVAVARQTIIRGRAELARVRERIRRASRWAVPDWFMTQALCVHDGWWHETHAPFRRTRDVPDGLKGGSGEADWSNRSYYRGGMQFAFSTWRRAGGSGDPADATPAEQIYRAYVIVVRQDSGSWSEWPQTSRACGWR